MNFKKHLYFLLGFCSLFCGILGIFLPLLPTTPFLLLSAFCFAKSSPRFYFWLKSNKYLNSYIENYQKNCGVPTAIIWRSIAFLWTGLILSSLLWKNFYYWLLLFAVGFFVSIHLFSLKRSDRASRNFTLLELLISLGIITVLASLLMPSVLRARDKANRSHCISNLKQIGNALHLYANDYEDHIPPIMDSYLSLSIPIITMQMGPRAQPVALGKLCTEYNLPAELFGCPANHLRKPKAIQKAWNDGGTVQTAYIYRETDYGLNKVSSSSKNSGKAILMDFACIPHSGDILKPHNFESVNILYLDGHVRNRKNNPTKGVLFTTWTTDTGGSTSVNTPNCDYIWKNADYKN